MVEALLSAMAFVVFGLFWLSTQDWFEMLPRAITRLIGGLAAVVLVGTSWLVPSAFKAGLHRFVNYTSDQMTEKLQDLVHEIFDPLTTGTPTSPPPASSR